VCPCAHSLKHLNKKPEYLKDWWEVVNWKAVSDNYAAAKAAAA
jgi:Fe-Mn family superoxide dismutase